MRAILTLCFPRVVPILADGSRFIDIVYQRQMTFKYHFKPEIIYFNNSGIGFPKDGTGNGVFRLGCHGFLP